MARVEPSLSAETGRTCGRQRAAFLGLWFAWLVLLGGAMALGNLEAGHGAAAATAGRMGSSLVLVVVGWLASGLWRDSPPAKFALCLALGMTLGTIGDFFNAGLLSFIPLPDPVLGGIAAFALGHLAYIAGCLRLGRQAGLLDRRALGAAVIAWQLIGLVGWYLVALGGSQQRDLVWPALPYTLLLAGTAGVTSGLALQDRRLAPLAVGGALFLTSDLMLAVGLFRGNFSYQTEFVWLTYGPGQMLIVFSVLRAAAILGRPGAALRT